jgi:hypothetical protein
MGRLILTLLGAAALVLAPSPPLHVKAASKIELRSYQEAVRSPEGEANAREVLQDHKSIEKVVAFYRQRLGAVSPFWMLAKADDLDASGSWPPPFSSGHPSP